MLIIVCQRACTIHKPNFPKKAPPYIGENVRMFPKACGIAVLEAAVITTTRALCRTQSPALYVAIKSVKLRYTIMTGGNRNVPQSSHIEVCRCPGLAARPNTGELICRYDGRIPCVPC